MTDFSPASIDYDFSGTKNPYDNIDLSIIIASRDRPEKFKLLIDSLSNTCSDPSRVEILIKLDSDEPQLKEYIEILQNIPFMFKMLCYPAFSGYWSLYIFQDHLIKAATGKTIWALGDCMWILNNKWLEIILATRDIFPDNIYVCSVSGHERILDTGAYVVSKEFVNVLNKVSPFPEIDVWLPKMSAKINRFIRREKLFDMGRRHWKLHDRTALKKANWGRAKQNMDKYTEKYAPLFYEKMIMTE